MMGTLTDATDGMLQDDSAAGGGCTKVVARENETVTVVPVPDTDTVVRTPNVALVAARVVAPVTVNHAPVRAVVTGRVDTQTILSVVNVGPPGADGQDGADGAPGADGTNGVDGVDGESDKNYRHVQTAPLALWTIIHSLNKYPAVNIVDSAGTEVVGDVVYISPSTVTVSFISAFAGEAFCN